MTERPRKRYKVWTGDVEEKIEIYSSKDLVNLLVGRNGEKVIAHGNQLSETSEFFRRALKEEWIECQTHTIRLPEESTEEVTHHLDWVYNGELPTRRISTYADLKASISQEGIDPVFDTLFKLYIFGDRRLDEKVQQAAIREIVRLCSLVGGDGVSVFMPGNTTIDWVYADTAARSPIRRLLVDIYVTHARSTSLDKIEDEEFLRDVGKAFISKACSGVSPSKFRGKLDP